MKFASPLLVALLLAAPPAALAQPPGQAAAKVAGFEGTWRLENKPQARKKVADAVESVAEDVNFLLRGFVRDKLLEVNEPCGELDIGVSGQDVAIRCDTKPVADAPVDGTPIRYVSSKDVVFRLRHQVQDTMLRQSFAAEDGTRTSLFRLSADGDSMTVSSYLTSPHFDGTVRYALTYVRIEE